MLPEALQETLTCILAGGIGNRLYPLTKDRAKPAVPFGGTYRIIDFTLSNCVNSGLRRIVLLTQYKSGSLDRHLRLGWSLFNPELGDFIQSIPPQQRVSHTWYLGTADAVYQNIYTLQQERPKYTLILSGDHIYSMDYREMLEFHIRTNAELTVAAVEIPVAEGSRFGIIQTDEQQRMVGFQEKPPHPRPIPGTDRTLGSMGVYLFNTDLLVRAVSRNAKEQNDHDFGKNVIPALMDTNRVVVFPFRKYWRDIGTIDSYYDANLELLQAEPPFDIFDHDWPVRTYHPQFPPGKICGPAANGGGHPDVTRTLVSPGCTLGAARVDNCILGPDVHIANGAEVRDSVILSDVRIGENCRIQRAIIDKHVTVPKGTSIGYNPEQDRKMFTVSEEGISVVPRAMIFE